MLFHDNCMCVGAGGRTSKGSRREGGRERRNVAPCVVNVCVGGGGVYWERERGRMGAV